MTQHDMVGLFNQQYSLEFEPRISQHDMLRLLRRVQQAARGIRAAMLSRKCKSSDVDVVVVAVVAH